MHPLEPQQRAIAGATNPMTRYQLSCMPASPSQTRWGRPLSLISLLDIRLNRQGMIYDDIESNGPIRHNEGGGGAETGNCSAALSIVISALRSCKQAEPATGISNANRLAPR